MKPMDWVQRLLTEGDAAIDAMIDQRVPETLELECKSKADPGKPKFEGDDRRNLGKALSGFANSMGGTLIFGLDARPVDGVDCVTEKKPIRNVAAFAEELRSLVGTLVMPRLDDVEVRTFGVSDQGQGYVAVLVPRSDRRPHRSEAAGDKTYYRRSGTSFHAMEHFEIEDAFKRNTVPTLEFVIATSQHGSMGGVRLYHMVLCLKNTSHVTAKFPYLAIDNLSGAHVKDSAIGSYEQRGLRRTDQGRLVRIFGGVDVAIHPGVELGMCALELRHKQEPDGTQTINDVPAAEFFVSFGYSIGCDNAQMSTGRICLPAIALPIKPF